MNENVSISSEISLRYVPLGLIYNNPVFFGAERFLILDLMLIMGISSQQQCLYWYSNTIKFAAAHNELLWLEQADSMYQWSSYTVTTMDTFQF